MLKNLSISRVLVAIGLLVATDVWRRIGGSYEGVVWSIPLFVGGMAVWVACVGALLAAFGDQTVDNKAKAWLDYLSYPGILIGLVGCGWEMLIGYSRSGAAYDVAFLSGCALVLILIGNFGKVVEHIAMAAHRAAESAVRASDAIDSRL